MAPIFGETLAVLAARGRAFEAVLPTPPRLRPLIEDEVARWPIRPRIVTGQDEKLAAFRSARAALAASGTVTLELALAGVPLVGAYRVALFEAILARFVLSTESVLLANIALGEPVLPELLQFDCRPDRLAAELERILEPGPAREAQRAAFRRLDELLSTGGRPAAGIAADRVAETAARGGAPRQIAAAPPLH